MKRLIAVNTGLYDGTGPFNNQINNLRIGERVVLGNSFMDNGMEWLEVIGDERVIGYIKGDTSLINPDKYCYLNQEFTGVHISAERSSEVIKQYKKGDEFYIIEVLSNKGIKWYKTIDTLGCSGYVEGDIYLLTSEVAGKTMTLNEDNVSIYQEPDSGSTVISTKMSGLEVVLHKIVKDSHGRRWFEADIPKEGIGYIKGNVKLLSEHEMEEWRNQLKENNVGRMDVDVNSRIPVLGVFTPLVKWLFYQGMVGGTILFLMGVLFRHFVGRYSIAYFIISEIMIFAGLAAFIRHLVILFIYRNKA